jgi:hypothetical protein
MVFVSLSKMTIMERQLFRISVHLCSHLIGFRVAQCVWFMCSDVSIIVCLFVLLFWPLFFRLRLTSYDNHFSILKLLVFISRTNLVDITSLVPTYQVNLF